ncbi:CRISPR-associated DxTHG motif protein [Nonomuraea jabiensis]
MRSADVSHGFNFMPDC